ncbi:MAG: hypothetical protein E7637_04675 [Ruminococcaceae bacterium]|nr:hypothetical protein [Oscillospiraceae bacterium]
MTKALLKKQFLEIFAWFRYNARNGKRRKGIALFGFAALYLYLFGFLGYFFFMFADGLAPLYSIGKGWISMLIMSLVGILLGVIGSIFSTYNILYRAKDNDLLLSLPIPPSKILFVRLLGVYLMGLLYELLVMVPTLIVFFQHAKPSVAGALFAVLLPFVLSLFVLTLSCLLGYVIAWITARMRRKNLLTVLAALLFMVLYYFGYSKMMTALSKILMYADALESKLRWIYPFYHLAMGTEGNLLSMLISTAIFALLFAVTVAVLAKSFLKLATTNRGEKKKVYRESRVKAGGVSSALLKKELRRFLSSPVYMLNCALGSVFMVVLGVLVLIKGRNLLSTVSATPMLGTEGLTVLIFAASLCMIASMNDVTAPSISLEGKWIWLVQVLPVRPIDVLLAKLKLHLWVTLPPLWFFAAASLIVLQPTWYYLLLLLLVATVFAVMMALIGLCLNLKFPNLKWVNEAVPVKQSMSVLLSMFGGWGIVLTAGLLYWLTMDFLSPVLFLGIVVCLIAAACILLWQWLRTRGAKILAFLT